MTSVLHMDEGYLRGLKRSELQKLAREHKIKANLKSKVIIDLLLQRLADNTKPREGARSGVQQIDALPPALRNNGPRSRSGSVRDTPALSFAKEKKRRPVARADDENSQSSGKHHPVDGPRFFYKPLDLDQMARNIGLSYPGSPPDIENFDREQLPAPEALVEETVAMLAESDKGDQLLFDRITGMREMISELKSQIRNTRALLRSEDARRRRAVQYYLYWQPIARSWSYEEVWSGPMKVRNDEDTVGVTTSDEEDEEDAESEGDAAARDASNHFNDANEQVTFQNMPSPQGAQAADPLLSPIDVPLTFTEPFNIIAGHKRRREDEAYTPSDDARYAPRRRMEQKCPETGDKTSRKNKAEALERLDSISPPLTPILTRRVDKGKAKMTAEQNERLENERAAEQLLAQIAAEVYRSSPEAPQAALLGHPKLSYERVSLGDRDSGRTCQRPPTDYCETETAPVELAYPGSGPEPGLDPDNPPVTGTSQPEDNHQNNVEADNNAEVPAASPAAFSSASQQPHPLQSTRKRKRGD